ncbi:MAG: hypothetical protein GFGODING_02318 [Flavobacteriales bacterium]|nr:hypothetical protein [Flavobacteriales bacterium]
MDAPVTARHHRIAFDLDRDAGWYVRRPELVPYPKVPHRLKVERTQVDRFREQGAEVIITGPMRAKRRTFYTGLRPLPDVGWYIGNDHELLNGKKVLSLVLFWFSPDMDELTLFYFPRYYRADRTDRERWAVAFIRTQERQGAA